MRSIGTIYVLVVLNFYMNGLSGCKFRSFDHEDESISDSGRFLLSSGGKDSMNGARKTNKVTDGILAQIFEKPAESINITFFPTIVSSSKPSTTPSASPEEKPSARPSYVPSIPPSELPSLAPVVHPSNTPSITPSTFPTTIPTSSLIPSVFPTLIPTSGPTLIPSKMSSRAPSINPSVKPSIIPSFRPSINPSVKPSIIPSFRPSTTSSFSPSETLQPTKNSLNDLTNTQLPQMQDPKKDSSNGRDFSEETQNFPDKRSLPSFVIPIVVTFAFVGATYGIFHKFFECSFEEVEEDENEFNEHSLNQDDFDAPYEYDEEEYYETGNEEAYEYLEHALAMLKSEKFNDQKYHSIVRKIERNIEQLRFQQENGFEHHEKRIKSGLGYQDDGLPHCSLSTSITWGSNEEIEIENYNMRESNADFRN